MKDKEQVKQEISELETRDEIQDYLEQLWADARREAYNIERLMFLHNFDEELDTDEVLEILDEGVDGVEHK